MNTRQKLTEMKALRALPELYSMYRVARRGAIAALAQQQPEPLDPLGTVSHTAPAEGEGAQPGGVIRGKSPCATTPPRRVVSYPDQLRDLAACARRETLAQWATYGGSADWSGNIGTALGGATGEYVAAVGPDVVDALLDERDRYHDALTVIADNPCSSPAGPMGCADRVGRDDGEWCSYCLARAVLNPQVRR